jgi:predicted PurR-regulated permease PerM
MKIVQTQTTKRKRQSGIASIIMLFVLALVFGFVIANMNTLSGLHNDVKRIEQRQIRRINPIKPAASTNLPTAQAVK